ncbi:MAG: hypothetical protein AAGB34_06755, partial [Planctomycetota bacterium]
MMMLSRTVALAAVGSVVCGQSAAVGLEIFIPLLSNETPPELYYLFGSAPAPPVLAGARTNMPVVFDEGVAIQDPVDPNFASPFASVISSVDSNNGAAKTRYFAPAITDATFGLDYSNGEQLNIEGDATVSIELFDNVATGGGGGSMQSAIDLGIVTLSFGNSALISSGLLDSGFTGGLTISFSFAF